MTDHFSRFGIFVFFDPHGIVDDYVIHLLKALRPHFRKLVTVSNTDLDQQAKGQLLRYSDELFIRENRGLDAAAYKEALISFCGWDEVEQYDEVILFNDTFFGPIHSFDEMFSQMSRRDLDFWGMSAGYHSLDGWKRMPKGFYPDHIQTFFIAFRKNMVRTDAFHSYWHSYDDTVNDFISVVLQNEVLLTRHFEDLGFRWDIYVDTERYRSKLHSENFNIYHHHPCAMMRDMHFPVLKRKVLNVNLTEHFCAQDLESASDAMEYIRQHSDYDTAMIWNNVLRLYNISDLYNTMHLTHVLPSVKADIPENKKIALVYRVINPFFAEPICRHVDNLTDVADIYIIPENPEAEQLIREFTQNRQRVYILKGSGQKTEMGSFVLCCQELADRYDYLGFVHDTVNPDFSASVIAESTVYGYLQNIANDADYLSQIINCFETNPRLGVLGVPHPIHDYHFNNFGNMWGNCFDTVLALARELNLHCNLDEGKSPFMVIGAFWCRTDAIHSIWTKKWSDTHFLLNAITFRSKTNDALIRLLPYAAQSARYYSGTVMHTNYAAMRLIGQHHIIDEFVRSTKQNFNCSAPRYKAYMDQLRAISSRESDSPLMIDLSQFNIARIIQIYLNQNMPPWFSRNIQKILRFLKNQRK